MIRIQLSALGGVTILAMLAVFSSPGWSADAPSLAAKRLSEYIQIETVNPPGNEIAGVKYLAGILDEAGIAYETAESAPGRGNLWARLPAANPKTAKPGIILLHHIDVVSASAGHWDHPPFSGTISEGLVYGRGALDTKGLGIIQLQAFLALAESGVDLNRDVMLMATADEEAGGHFGVGWLLQHRPEIFEGMGFALNEGGGGVQLSPTQAIMSVEVTQKVPLWLRLTASGKAGHGSSPRVESSVTRLVRAAHRIIDTRFPVRVLEPVRAMFAGMAPFQPDAQLSKDFADLDAAILRPDFVPGLQLESPGFHGLLRNTCSLTRLEASNKVNVVPPEASLEMDCRLLPDQSPEVFTEELALIVNDPMVKIEKIMGFSPASSSTDTELFRAIVQVTEQIHPGTAMIPAVLGGFTDSHFLRDAGITSYGYSPVISTPGEAGGVHGNNERVPISYLDAGVTGMTALLRHFAVE